MPHLPGCLQAALVLGLLPTVVFGDLDNNFSDNNFTDLYEAFPQLTDLQIPFDANPAGGQNFTRCCLQAVYESYQIIDGRVVNNPANPYVTLSPSELSDTEFPCGATYSGSAAGAPIVSVPFWWCSENCGGWELSSNTILTQWIQPFVGFILPAAVFCLNIPRKKSLTVSDTLFHDHAPQLREHWRALMRRLLGIHPPAPAKARTNSYSSTISIALSVVETMSFVPKTLDFLLKLATFLLYFIVVVLEMILRGSVAALIALFDTVIWLAIVFSAAAPMMLSGLYEATIDRLVVEALEKEMRKPLETLNGHMLRHRVHLLYGILVGNLVLKDTPDEKRNQDGNTQEAERSAWHDIERLVMLIPDDLTQSADLVNEIKRVTHVRLTSMLGCQASFGASIGAAVVFFLGSFLFSVFGNLSILGDNDTSHALAFGEWWMTIPHVAVVSGCLLAGNNPNTLEAIYSGVEAWDVSKKTNLHTVMDAAKAFVLHPFGAVYDAVYQPVWMWERGRNKRNWIRKIQREYYPVQRTRKPIGLWRPVRDWAKNLPIKYGYDSDHEDFSAPIPQELPDLDFLDWMRLLFVASVLNIGPFVLAFLTSFFTPYVGLSCRSFTFALYFFFQIWLSVIWFWDFHHDAHFELWYILGRTDEQELGNGTQKQTGVRIPRLKTLITLVGIVASACTAILGTFMQLLGLFRNCRCIVPLTVWTSPDFRDFMIPISTNGSDSIFYAQKYWMPTGWASILLMIVVCYVGWWYQRHWRRLFLELIDILLIPDQAADRSLAEQKQPAGEMAHVSTSDVERGWGVFRSPTMCN